MKRRLEFAVSTLAFAGTSAEEMVHISRQHDLALEFSSGLPYRADMSQLYLEAAVKRYPHNYFPAPEVPFVLNLASNDENIRSRSIGHCLRGLELAKASGAPFFSAHAGFCIDPDPSQLGKKLAVEAGFEREIHWAIFLDSLAQVLQRAEKLELKFLVENNVLSPFNARRDGKIALFCCDAEEIENLFRHFRSPALGLLLDTAHLKVSARTQGFDPDKAVQVISGCVNCIHHSDNDGHSDNNMPLDDTYWFLRHMPAFLDAVHVLEVKEQTLEQIFAQRELLERAAYIEK